MTDTKRIETIAISTYIPFRNWIAMSVLRLAVSSLFFLHLICVSFSPLVISLASFHFRPSSYSDERFSFPPYTTESLFPFLAFFRHRFTISIEAILLKSINRNQFVFAIAILQCHFPLEVLFSFALLWFVYVSWDGIVLLFKWHLFLFYNRYYSALLVTQ